MQLSFDYDRSYSPPFPVLELTVISTRTDQQVSVIGLIDSGSDATQFPLNLLQRIGARGTDQRWLRDSSGLRHPVLMYAVRLHIGSVAIDGVEVIGRRGTDEVIIGRDVLNHFIVTMNGLAAVTDIRN